MQRRKFLKSSAVVTGASLVSAPVLGKNLCTVSGAMSGNMSNAELTDACDSYKGDSAYAYAIEIIQTRSTLDMFDGYVDMGNSVFVESELFFFLLGDPLIENQFDYIPSESEQTLFWVLDYTGNNQEAILIRESITALLNSIKYSDNFPYTPIEIDNLYIQYKNSSGSNIQLLIETFQGLNQGA